MMYFNLTDEQKAALREVMKRFKQRPTSEEYDKVQRDLKSLNKPSRIPREFPKARSNWTKNSYGDKWPVPTVLLDPGFTHSDVPLGFAVYAIYTSAGTHAVDHALKVCWTELWNFWDTPPTVPTVAGTFKRDIAEALK